MNDIQKIKANKTMLARLGFSTRLKIGISIELLDEQFDLIKEFKSIDDLHLYLTARCTNN